MWHNSVSLLLPRYSLSTLFFNLLFLLPLNFINSPTISLPLRTCFRFHSLSLSRFFFAVATSSRVMGDLGDFPAATEEPNSESSDDQIQRLELDIYPLNCYYFGSKHAIPSKPCSLSHHLQRMKSNYAARGIRTCVEAVILVELFKHPHLLVLQVRNSIFKLPGGRLRPGESDTDGLKRKLVRKLSTNEEGDGAEWEVGECLGMWWRPDFETPMYPFLPPNIKQPKECTKLFLVRLPESRKFMVPKNLRLLSVPLCQIRENHKTYGEIISGIPQLLSKFSFNMIES